METLNDSDLQQVAGGGIVGAIIGGAAGAALGGLASGCHPAVVIAAGYFSAIAGSEAEDYVSDAIEAGVNAEARGGK